MCIIYTYNEYCFSKKLTRHLANKLREEISQDGNVASSENSSTHCSAPTSDTTTLPTTMPTTVFTSTPITPKPTTTPTTAPTITPTTAAICGIDYSDNPPILMHRRTPEQSAVPQTAAKKVRVRRKRRKVGRINIDAPSISQSSCVSKHAVFIQRRNRPEDDVPQNDGPPQNGLSDGKVPQCGHGEEVNRDNERAGVVNGNEPSGELVDLDESGEPQRNEDQLSVVVDVNGWPITTRVICEEGVNVMAYFVNDRRIVYLG